jgi:hypothetical protein
VWQESTDPGTRRGRKRVWGDSIVEISLDNTCSNHTTVNKYLLFTHRRWSVGALGQFQHIAKISFCKHKLYVPTPLALAGRRQLTRYHDYPARLVFLYLA